MLRSQSYRCGREVINIWVWNVQNENGSELIEPSACSLPLKSQKLARTIMFVPISPAKINGDTKRSEFCRISTRESQLTPNIMYHPLTQSCGFEKFDKFMPQDSDKLHYQCFYWHLGFLWLLIIIMKYCFKNCSQCDQQMNCICSCEVLLASKNISNLTKK